MRIIRRQTYDLILGADLHIREDTPVCRTDDYLDAQFSKMDFIQELCKTSNCPFVVAGDIFDHWKPSPYLLSRCLELLPERMICVAGQHDMVNHNTLEMAKTGLNTLVQAGRVLILEQGRSSVVSQRGAVYGYSYGEKPAGQVLQINPKLRNILLLHRLVCQSTQPWPDANADQAASLLRTFPSFDLIVTGDNHQQFAVEHKGRWLVNPGSMMRMTTEQEDHEPAVYGWKAEDNSIERILLPIKQGVISKTHIGKEKKVDRDVRMEAYIKRAKRQYESKLSFITNLELYIKNNGVESDVSDLIWKAVEGELNEKQ